MRPHVGIFPKLLFTMVILAVIPLGTSWYINYRTSLMRISAEVEHLLSTQSDAVVTYVDTWMEMNIKMLRQNASLDDIVSMNPERQKPILKSILKEYTWISTANGTSPTGQQIARGDNDTLKYLGDRLWFQQAIQGSLGADFVISRSHGVPTCSLAVPILDEAQKPKGVLQIGASIASVSDSVIKVKIGNTGYAYLTDENGTLVAHQKKEFTQVLVNMNKNPAFIGLGQATKKKTIFTDATTGVKTVSFAQRTKLGWVLIVQQDYDEAYAPVAEANRNALVVLGVTLVLVLLISYVLARRLTRPILNLAQIADNISRGELTAKIKETDRIDEIGELARAIERLEAAMKLAIERLNMRKAG